MGAAASGVVSLELSAQNVRDKDLLSKSDPCAVVFVRVGPAVPGPGAARPAHRAGGWQEIGRTEQIKNDLNPRWSTRIKLDYHFEQEQRIRIAIYDIDSRSKDLGVHDALGEVETTLGNVVSSSPWTERLKYPVAADNKTITGAMRDLGTLTVVAHEQSSAGRIRVRFQASAEKLPRMDFGGLGRSDPYLIVRQTIQPAGAGAGGGGAPRKPVLSQVYKTEVVRSNSNPHWRVASFFIQRAPSQPLSDVKLILTVMDKDDNSKDDMIGEVRLSAAELTATPSTFNIINAEKKRRKGSRYTNSGKLRLANVSVTPMPTFVQYLQNASLSMRFIIAIDFTGSNGDPRTPQSLHSMADPVNRPNEYVRALTSVGSVLASYDPTQQFAALGFGGELPGSGQRSVSHNFSLNGSSNPYCSGIPGVLNEYQRCLWEVRLSGPTYAAPIIRHAMQLARAPPPAGGLSYYVLLLLTDGVLNDMDATVSAIIDACELPLSIAIVGIGGADFGNMRVLDADNVRLRSRDGRTASADIVNFVGFRERGGDPSALAAEVLAEVPNRVVEYFVERNKMPRAVAPS